ncbi:MAG: aspartyl protease family protein [Planctomycetes bacterium]|nr:aspartyl protease family protein [Planctomycetota bacterium]
MSAAGWTIGVLLLLMGGVTLLALLPDGSSDGGPRAAPEAESPARAAKRWTGESAPGETARAEAALVAAEQDSGPPSSSRVRLQAQGSLVILELRKEEDQPLRDVHGVVLTEDGVVLSRFQPLLGAHRGTCRLPGSGERRVEIRGVAYHDAARDLALLRIGAAAGDVQPLPFLEDDPAALFLPGDEIYVFSGYRLSTASIAQTRAWIAGGAEGLLLAGDPPVAAESLMALDAYGSLIGLCRPIVDGAPASGDERVRAEEYDVVIDPVAPLLRHVGQPVALTLYQLTVEYFQGTFADLAARGRRACAAQSWAEAIDLLGRAVARAELERAAQEQADEVSALLRESYLREIERLFKGRRLEEASRLAETAIDRFPRDAPLWRLLADAREAQGLVREALDALLVLREIQPGDAVEKDLQDGYLLLAGEGRKRSDSRFVEAALLEGIEQLPRSGTMRFELARLYQDWEAYDDAIRLYESARELDRSLADQVEVYLDRIDDILKRRDAVIVPIAAGSSLIRAQVVVDGRWEHQFVIDTGATHTTVPYRTAVAMGYVPEEGRPVRIDTAGMSTTGHKIQVHSVSLGGYAVRNLEVIVLPESSPIQTGLLGQNFLRFFRYSVDTARGEFRLERQ